MTDSPNAALSGLLRTLKDEAAALRTLDIAGIDRAAQQKEALEPRLRELLGTELSPAIAPELDEIRTLARENKIRLAATLSTVRGLVHALTTDAQPSYGRRPTAPTKPVLASVMG